MRSDSTRYEGRRLEPRPGELEVTRNGHPLEPRLDLRNHSPSGFEWGYGGSGPAQLSLAILADFAGDELALKYYHRFKGMKIAAIHTDEWTLFGSAIRAWLEAQA